MYPFLEDGDTEISEKDAAYIRSKYEKIAEKLPEIDKLINETAIGWDTQRMGKVELTIIRLAVYEIRFDETGSDWRRNQRSSRACKEIRTGRFLRICKRYSGEICMKNVYTVAQVNGYIKNMFTQDFLLQSILVKGEVSNCKYHSSGHIYFTLKDGKGAIACVMFAGNRSGLKFHMQEGQQVVVGGTIDVFERDGRYQLYAKSITLDGAGQLYERFEQLKRELAEQGLFAPEYKQPIPRFIRTLGVVTAPTGAAVRDIINIATRRNPYVQIILYPAIVQGEQAPASIVNGIRALERCKVDVMIVGRGGGSIEDLWAFNEEIGRTGDF